MLTVESKQIVGRYREIAIYFKVSKDAWPSECKIKSAVDLAKLYIDAAFSLVPDFQSTGFDAEYGKNNLWYLAREWDETGQLYRVFNPFAPAEAGSADIEAAKEIALYRAVLEPPEEPDYLMTPEVQALLEQALLDAREE